MRIPCPRIVLYPLAVTALVFAGTASAATTLSGNSAASNSNIDAAYGSNLIGTANIALTWSPVNPSGTQSFDGWQAYTDSGWTNASAINTTGTGVYQMGNGATVTNYDILFTPDAGYAVKLSQLDINVYNGGGTFAMQASIMDASGTTSFATLNQSFSAGNTTWSLGNYTGTAGQALRLRLNVVTAGSGGGYLAMDNLAFDQVAAVPEPSAYGLLGAAALAGVVVRRRRRG